MMPDFEHQEWLENEKKRKAAQMKKTAPKKKKSKNDPRDSDADTSPKKWTENTDDDEYYE